MTATTAVYRPGAVSSGPGLAGLSIPLVLFSVIPILVAWAAGGWVRLMACIVAVGAASVLVADGFIGSVAVPAPEEPCEEDLATPWQKAG